ncbi:MAG: ABC transporter ATP-binding protein [Clostridiales bacterium]|nr:ABC transporter ATP-binding protein [Clostridiales bacterium]
MTALEIKNLVVHYETPEGVAEAVNNVSLSISSGETLGLVGETGAGKTTIALTIMGLLPRPAGRVIKGEILVNGENVVETSRRKRKLHSKDKMLRKLRGSSMGMIFQDPMSALNPVMRVGDQITEVIRLHGNMSRSQSVKRAKEMMELVGISSVRYNDYPHEFSGGMKQRIVIAMALACNPGVLIADEPTTALDVTIQAQVLELMNELKRKFNTALLMITHDLGVVADICDKCAVLYAGEIMEYGTVEHIFNNPRHPYTLALFNALPSLDKDVERLKSISGLMSDNMNLPTYCTFYERCDKRCQRCSEGDPVLTQIEPGHFVKCFHLAQEQEDKANTPASEVLLNE